MISLDYTNMLAPTVSGGIAEQDWTAAASAVGAAFDGVAAKRAAGQLGFLVLADDAALLAQAVDFARERHGRYTDVVLLGIGGSALGPIALRTALRAPQWNALDETGRGGWPPLHVLDNVD